MENKEFFLKTKKIGIVIIILSMLGLAVLINSAYSIAIKGHRECTLMKDDAGSCTVIGHVPYESYLGIFALLIVIAIGLYMYHYYKKLSTVIEHKSETVANHVKSLSEEEKKIYELIKSKDGAAFQSDLIREIGFSKVKVSRIIDKMEMKGIVERRRRGMSNMVVLK